MSVGTVLPGAALSFIAERRASISAVLATMAAERGRILDSRMAGGSELMARVLEYARRGKMLRGALVYLGAGLWEGRPQAPAAAGLDGAAAAMELFQAGLLIHDDIMDRDEVRRGAPAFHSRYAAEAREEGAADPARLGEALGICAGDLCFFEGFAALAVALSRAGAAGSELLALCSAELSVVGLAQMRDCRWSALPDEPDEAAILAMYRGKTARYSFSLPLAAGALLAGHGDAAVALAEIGELAGISFQLRDDELGLFGDEAVTGKSSSSDILEGKKTLYRARLLARVDDADRRRLAGIFGNAEATLADAAFVRERLESLGVREELRARREAMAARGQALVEALPGANAEGRHILADLIDYSITRQS